MPHAAKRSDDSPDLIWSSRHLDSICDDLQLRIRRRLVRKGCAARLRRMRDTSVQEFSIVVHHPGKHDIDDICVYGTATARLVSTPMESTFLDLKETGIAHRLRHIEQQEIIEIDIDDCV